jgi:membrane-bound serine protease (ClpP class)
MRVPRAPHYLMFASHIAAMAPATNIGSSTPVSLGGEGSPFPMPGGSEPDKGKSPDKTSGDGVQR